MNNLFAKICDVRKAVGRIDKDSKGYNYDYQGADAVFTAVRSAMNDHNLLLFPSVNRVEACDGSWVLEYTMTWVDADTGDNWSGQWAMTIPMTDSKNRLDDKALGKAGTYALRYYLLRTLMITTKDDIDNDIDAGSPDNLPQRPPQNRQQRPQQAQEAPQEMHVVVHSMRIESDGKRPYLLADTVDGHGIRIDTRQPFEQAGYDVSTWTQPGTIINLEPAADVMYNQHADGSTQFVAVEPFDFD